MKISERGEGYIIVEDYLNEDQLQDIWKTSELKKYEDGKVGTNVNKEKKRRKDCFFYRDECAYLDTIFFTKASPLIIEEFDVSICFRERWKIGHYSGEDKGFYIPHTDIQGEGDTMHYRKISLVAALSNPEDYEGGELHFPELKKSFRLKKGSAIFFRSGILHGVTPVTKGDRYVLISFTFDQDGGMRKLKYASSLADYYPKCDMSLLPAKPFLNTKDGLEIVGEEITKYISPKTVVPLTAVSASTTTSDTTSIISHEDGISIKVIPIDEKDSITDDSLHTSPPSATIASPSTRPTSVITKSKSTEKYLLPITPDSGPGNQIVGIKEALIMSYYTNRICILPPICQHYTRSKTPEFWNFEDIYKYTGTKAVLLSSLKPHINIEDISNAICVHGNYLKKTLKLENHLGLKYTTETLASKRKFRDESDYKEIKSISTPHVLCVKHIFNNTCISTCAFNGCNDCKINNKLEPIYSTICADFDFSDTIHGYAREFIYKKLGGNYIAIHMRYPDAMGTKKLADFAGYSEADIYSAIIRFKETRGLTTAKVFIATNNMKAAQSSPLSEFVLYQSDSPSAKPMGLAGTAFTKRHSADIDSFVEQCICAQSKYFIMSKYNDYSKKDEPHQRSTWSSFIKDYRQHYCNIPASDDNSRCILLTDIL